MPRIIAYSRGKSNECLVTLSFWSVFVAAAGADKQVCQLSKLSLVSVSVFFVCLFLCLLLCLLACCYYYILELYKGELNLEEIVPGLTEAIDKGLHDWWRLKETRQCHTTTSSRV